MVDFFGGYDRIQWFFAVMSVLAAIFIYYCLPETHNRELSEIQDYFQNNTFYVGRKKTKRTPTSNLPPTREEKRQPKPSKALEALEEYDTLIHREDGQHATILPSDGNKFFVGNTDTTKLEYIDKSTELLSSQSRDNLDGPRVIKSPTTASIPE